MCIDAAAAICNDTICVYTRRTGITTMRFKMKKLKQKHKYIRDLLILVVHRTVRHTVWRTIHQNVTLVWTWL